MGWFLQRQTGGGSSYAPLYTGAWAGRPAAAANAGAFIIVTDIPVGGGQSEWYSDGTYWRTKAPTTLASKVATTTGLVQTAEQIIGVLGPIPAGALSGGNFAIRVAWGRTLASDTYATPTSIRLGTAGTLADSILRSFNLGSALTNVSSILNLGTEQVFSFDNDLSVHYAGTNSALLTNNTFTSFTGTVGGIAQANTTVAVPDLSANDLYVSFSTAMNAAVSSAPLTGYCDIIRFD